MIGSNAATAAPDLLDRRDQLIANLVGYTGGTAVAQDGGTLNVHRRRQAGGRYHRLEGDHGHRPLPARAPATGAADPGRQDHPGPEAAGRPGRWHAGIPRHRADPGPAPSWPGLATTFNETHRNGVDLYGNMGGDLFNIGSPRVTGNTSNTGTASITASYGDLSSLDAQNIVLKYDGTQWLAMRSDTGASVAMTGTGTATDPLKINGVELVVSGTPATNDRFLLQPTAGVAAASAWRSPIPRAWPRPPIGQCRAGQHRHRQAERREGGRRQQRQPAQPCRNRSPRPPNTPSMAMDRSPHRRPGDHRQWLEFRARWRAEDRRYLQHHPTPVGSSDNSNALALAKVEDAGIQR